MPEVVKGPGLIRSFVDQLERRSDMRVRYRPKPSAFAGTERFDPASQHLDEKNLCHSGERDALAGALDSRLVHHALKNQPKPIPVLCRLQE